MIKLKEISDKTTLTFVTLLPLLNPCSLRQAEVSDGKNSNNRRSSNISSLLDGSNSNSVAPAHDQRKFLEHAQRQRIFQPISCFSAVPIQGKIR